MGLDMCCKIDDARLCEECMLVTVDKECDLCEAKTIRHPEADELDRQQYCVDCAGEITREEAIVRTWKDDPFEQCEDGMLITVCQGCEQIRQDELFGDGPEDDSESGESQC